MNTHQAKVDLAAAHQIIALLKMDDLTYTHMSVRVPGRDSFYIAPFGSLFEEVTPHSLIELDFSQNMLSNHPAEYNQTGYTIHSSVYKDRPEVNAIIHLHTTATITVSAMKCGLLPISQHALHLYEGVSYHKYDSLTLHKKTQGAELAESLGPDNMAMLLENHGVLTCGATLPEALFYLHHLEQACKIQSLAIAAGAENLITPSHEVCLKTKEDLLAFETHLGQRDWTALLRKLEREKGALLNVA